MSAPHHCPALFVSAPASGQGKTTVTAALAYRQRRRGRRVRVFKTGPDFLDPMILEHACGSPVYQLDLWMGGETHCRRLLYEAASASDLILIEGVMGLFDGNPSSADLAIRFGIPVLAVVDGSAMAQTFGAVALGLARYREDLTTAGVIANRVAGERHYQMLESSLPAGIPSLGWLPGDANIALPDRHLGLVQPAEINDLNERLERAASSLRFARDDFASPVTFAPQPESSLPKTLTNVRIAVAHDAAFSFIYRANLDVLKSLGAELMFFSPLRDEPMPPADSLYLPGGYPELYLRDLSKRGTTYKTIRRHNAAGKPIVAECGGMLYLFESLTDTSGNRAPMLDLLPGNAYMQKRLTAIALQEVPFDEGKLRGHTFHHSRLETHLAPITRGACPNGSHTSEAIFRKGRLTASYVHGYFPSNPHAVAAMFAP